MYIKLRNTAQAQLQLNMLDNLAEESGNPELTEELLYTKTDYFYIFEQKKEGDAAFNKLISQYREKKEYGRGRTLPDSSSRGDRGMPPVYRIRLPAYICLTLKFKL